MFLARAAKKTDISDDMYKVIESCNTIIKFNIPLKMDSGEIKTVECFRAQHSLHYLPTKGGTRYDEKIDF
jgi:glutamate dehydrogenase/leucine dehydrogenase